MVAVAGAGGVPGGRGVMRRIDDGRCTRVVMTPSNLFLQVWEHSSLTVAYLEDAESPLNCDEDGVQAEFMRSQPKVGTHATREVTCKPPSVQV